MVTGTESALFGIFNWIANKFSKDIIKGSAKKIKEIWDEPSLKNLAKAYEDEMRDLYGEMKIFGMAEPIPLKGIFTYVNVLKPSSIRISSPDQIEAMYLGRKAFGEVFEEGKNAMNAIIEKDKLFIFGKPGAGKTTLLKNITMNAIDGTINLIPIFIQLKIYSESNLSIFEFIEKQFKICNFPNAKPFIETMLDNGKAIILFDGLDEVNEENKQRAKTIRGIIDFSNEYRKNKMVISCRVAATDYTFEKFTYLEMADFNDDQIKLFVNKWFKSDAETNRFFDQFNKNSRLKDLAKVPLLLTLLCISFEETNYFSDRRSEIYEEAIDALLKKWDSSRKIIRDEIYQNLSIGRKRHMFARIAAESFEKKQYIFKQRELENLIVGYLKKLPHVDDPELIDGEAVLKGIEAQHGIFLERAKKVYSFSHLTFQEYFTAKYIINNAAGGTLGELVEASNDDIRWDEVTVLVAEMLMDAQTFLEAYAHRTSEMICGRVRTEWEIADARISIEMEGEDWIIERIEANKVLRRAIRLWFILIPRMRKERERDGTATYGHMEVELLDIAMTRFIGSRVKALFVAEGGMGLLVRRIGSRKGDDFSEMGFTDEGAADNRVRCTVRMTGLEDEAAISVYTHNVKTLEGYFKAAQRLFDCLDIAVVSDRESIEDLLF